MSFYSAIDINLEKFDGFADYITETILIANSVREVGIRIQLFHVVGNVPGNGGRVHPMIR
jgi:hypothetical protein